jgi:DNA repair exonuclease SbcCD ATPase subunit
MILFKKLRYKNILSTGNTFTEIDLARNPTTLVIGQNGSGKSTFLDALSFALFGKPFRKINKPQLLNSINEKNLVVEVDFSIGTKEYRIRRGIKPTVFEIWQDEVLLNQDAAARDYQEVLEKTILKLNHKSFCQIIILGSSTFVPFMQLPTNQRREIIEDLLDIQIFSTMNSLLKEKVTKNKSDLQEAKYQLDLIQEKILLRKDMIKKLRKSNDDHAADLEKKIDDAWAKVYDYEMLIKDRLADEAALRESISDQPAATKRRNSIVDLIKSMNDKIKRLTSEIAFYHDNDNCPTCKQGIAHEFKGETLEAKAFSLQEIENAKAQLEEQLLSADQRVNEISSVLLEISSIQRKISEYNGHISSGTAYINDTKKELANLQNKSIDDSSEIQELEKLKAEWKAKEKYREELIVDKEVLDVAAVLLKDGGIKAKIIKQYIPVINKLINKYLAIMELPVGFELDENFDETIRSRFRDVFSYASFSEGEKMRIDLAILFTWRAVAKMRNSSNANLLIMDEVFDSSVDVTGTEQIASIVESISGDSNVFIISHKESLIDKFTNIIKFEKVKDFSRIAINS